MESLYTKVVIKILTDRRNDCSLTETLKFLYFSPKIFNGQEKMEEFIKIFFLLYQIIQCWGRKDRWVPGAWLASHPSLISKFQVPIKTTTEEHHTHTDWPLASICIHKQLPLRLHTCKCLCTQTHTPQKTSLYFCCP